jgi:hypothetical protein
VKFIEQNPLGAVEANVLGLGIFKRNEFFLQKNAKEESSLAHFVTVAIDT